MDIIMTTNGNLFNEKKIKEVVDTEVTRILFSVTLQMKKLIKKLGPAKVLLKKLLKI